MKCISIETYVIKIIKNTKSKQKEPQKHIKITRPNNKFDWHKNENLKNTKSKTKIPNQKEHKIQNKNTKSKRKAQKPKPKKLKSLAACPNLG